jgi:AcrR family transcriptional regulator
MAVTRITRRRMSAEERREQLLDVTRDLVGEQGFHAVSIEAVARRAGITRPVIYGHFGDLDGLLEAMLDRESARALSQLADVLPSPDAARDSKEALVAGLRGYLEAVRANPVTWRLVLMPPEGTPAALRDRVAQGRAAVVAVLAQVVDAEVDDPRLRSATDDRRAQRQLEQLGKDGDDVDPHRFSGPLRRRRPRPP